eukprot:scaffold769_cov105-Isochrysis_galbana.AAC.5
MEKHEHVVKKLHQGASLPTQPSRYVGKQDGKGLQKGRELRDAGLHLRPRLVQMPDRVRREVAPREPAHLDELCQNGLGALQSSHRARQLAPHPQRAARARGGRGGGRLRVQARHQRVVRPNRHVAQRAVRGRHLDLHGERVDYLPQHAVRERPQVLVLVLGQPVERIPEAGPAGEQQRIRQPRPVHPLPAHFGRKLGREDRQVVAEQHQSLAGYSVPLLLVHVEVEALEHEAEDLVDGRRGQLGVQHQPTQPGQSARHLGQFGRFRVGCSWRPRPGSSGRSGRVASGSRRALSGSTCSGPCSAPSTRHPPVTAH